jgi:hypothetical protein
VRYRFGLNRQRTVLGRTTEAAYPLPTNYRYRALHQPLNMNGPTAENRIYCLDCDGHLFSSRRSVQ